MRFQILLFTNILLFTILFSGCGTAETPTNATNAANTNTANVNAVKNTNNPLATNKTPEETTTNKADTIAPVVTAFYEALKKKDDAALRKVYSQATLKSLEADMKEEGEKSLAKFITDLEPAPDKPFEVRNEQIQGDTAIAEIKGGAYPNGIKIKFVKENGEWKMTNESPAFDDVKKAANNSAK
jgi:uncharacterized protein YceK